MNIRAQTLEKLFILFCVLQGGLDVKCSKSLHGKESSYRNERDVKLRNSDPN